MSCGSLSGESGIFITRGLLRGGINESALETKTVERPLFVSVIVFIPGHRSGRGMKAMSA